VSRIVVLTGGVGGAKLVLGLIHAVEPASVTAIVNTGDDFRHLGLHISPDIDTLLYTLSGKANAAQGWGREGESWAFLSALKELGGEDWFQLGDMDVALHVLRTTILPMSNDPVATMIESDEGLLEFQRYFVEKRCVPAVRGVRFDGAATAQPAPGVVGAILAADAVLIAPSNPWLSVDPLLAVPAIRDVLTQTRAPVVAVSPLIGGQAVKGPTAKLMGELGLAVKNDSIAGHYDDLLNGFLIDSRDACNVPGLTIDNTDTLMTTLDDKVRVARAALTLAERLV